MNKLTIMLLFGGDSPEHEVSVRSAFNVYKAIDQDIYNLELCYINRRGQWWLLPDWQDDLQKVDGVQLSAMLGERSFASVDGAVKVLPDVILPVLHGNNGEDGTVQGLAELLRIPILGCDVAGSAVCWDKILTKQLLSASGILVVPYQIYSVGQDVPEYDSIAAELGASLFVKPARSGSSIGVSKVTNSKEFTAALELASKYSQRVLIEQAVVGRELEVGVLGNPPSHQVSGVGEIRPGEEFYSYDDKYDSTSAAEVIIDADLPDDVKRNLKNTAHLAFEALGCRGLSRIDFLLSENGTAYINEVNTFPGFTDISQYPQLWQAAGVDYGQLIERLIDSALADDATIVTIRTMVLRKYRFKIISKQTKRSLGLSVLNKR